MNVVKVAIKVSDENLDDILYSAFCSAKYWLYDENIGYISKFTYSFLVPTADDDSVLENYTLTKEKLLEGLNQYISKYGFSLDDEGYIDTCALDNFDCELILQYALFGEQVFG